MDHVTGLALSGVRPRLPRRGLHVCDYCFGPLEVAYDYEAIAARTSASASRKAPLDLALPDLLRHDEAPVDLGRFTPLRARERLAAELGLGEL